MYNTLRMAQRRDIANIKTKREMSPVFIRFSREVLFKGGFLKSYKLLNFFLHLEFCATFVSGPVKTAIPITQSVFLRTQSFSSCNELNKITYSKK
jgi:hypothetical protein